MKTTPRKASAGFTLIELMAVITIIVILAGLVVGGLGYVNEKSATSKAKVQIALLSKALEEYKLDNGTYPPTGNLATPTTVSATTAGNSDVLFKALYWDSDNDNQGAAVGATTGDTDQKIYLSDLDPATSKQGWTTGTASATLKILDPWGNTYMYRTAKSSDGTANDKTQNPDFDLWSAGKNGKTNATPTHADCRDDIKNF